LRPSLKKGKGGGGRRRQLIERGRADGRGKD